ncbi:hypothetical protein P153DRAFT_297935 [Dothidotthia symphoricarpi CBS 119687]|uniref:Histone chaperone domain-containing protein n=1 Tax=Dothidotthia symphoricarpi CBS 119687 TaxID=1392245 RepID=A0A6A6A540_9PLEO|nr:uncharacterized protein P153DRAFT_297935 [Dothidotthia symphoricarpi CBS 119687]KAF2126656.1 hypothetical protein P153DRAFT_297935 [Dothidotthia symphoricarpi CBS 119687]
MSSSPGRKPTTRSSTNKPATPTAKKAAPPPSDSDDDSSELSSSSEEPSDESSDDDSDEELEDAVDQDGVVNVRANRGKKPVMKLNKNEMGPDIRVFLKEFLPQLKAANDELAAQKKAGTLKSIDAMDGVEGGQGAAEVDEDKDYIEMDLGLGVLEVKDDRDGDNDDEMDIGEGGKERDVLGKLMGREKTGKPAVVQEMDTQRS